MAKKAPIDDNDDDDMKDLADGETRDDSSMKGKKAKDAEDLDGEQKADDGYDDEDVYKDGSMDNFEEASKNRSQPHLRPRGKAQASTPTASDGKGADKALRETVDRLASANQQLTEQVREMRLKERKAEVKDQIRQLSEGSKRFPKPVIEEFEKLALADTKAGDKAFALLKQVKATGMVDTSTRGRNADIEDELHDPYGINDKVLTDKDGHAIVGSGVVERAQRYCAEQKWDWEDLPSRTKAISAVVKNTELGAGSGVKRD